jgi:hypothetical protein
MSPHGVTNPCITIMRENDLANLARSILDRAKLAFKDRVTLARSFEFDFGQTLSEIPETPGDRVTMA